jgi:hypothetical protein
MRDNDRRTAGALCNTWQTYRALTRMWEVSRSQGQGAHSKNKVSLYCSTILFYETRMNYKWFSGRDQTLKFVSSTQYHKHVEIYWDHVKLVLACSRCVLVMFRRMPLIWHREFVQYTNIVLSEPSVFFPLEMSHWYLIYVLQMSYYNNSLIYLLGPVYNIIPTTYLVLISSWGWNLPKSLSQGVLNSCKCFCIKNRSTCNLNPRPRFVLVHL